MYKRRHKKGKGVISDSYNYMKNKLSKFNDYLKAKQIAKNLITDEINWGNPIRAISQGYNINKKLQNSIFNAPLQFLAWKGYGKKRRYRKKKI